jgi:hypothetical protein
MDATVVAAVVAVTALLALGFSAGLGFGIAAFMRAAARTPMPPPPGDRTPPSPGEVVPAAGPDQEPQP